jgi:hypothetical protein
MFTPAVPRPAVGGTPSGFTTRTVWDARRPVPTRRCLSCVHGPNRRTEDRRAPSTCTQRVGRTTNHRPSQLDRVVIEIREEPIEDLVPPRRHFDRLHGAPGSQCQLDRWWSGPASTNATRTQPVDLGVSRRPSWSRLRSVSRERGRRHHAAAGAHPCRVGVRAGVSELPHRFRPRRPSPAPRAWRFVLRLAVVRPARRPSADSEALASMLHGRRVGKSRFSVARCGAQSRRLTPAKRR